MKVRSFSIATLMFFVAVAALDASLLRQIDLGEENPVILSAAGIFVMVNILAFGLLRLVSLRGKNCAFLTGFEIAGTVAVLAYLACFRWWPDYAVELWVEARNPIESVCRPYAPEWFMACFYQQWWDQYPWYLKYPMDLVVLPVQTLPFLSAQLFVAVIGGALAKVLSKKTKGRAANQPQCIAL
jgi:hypothetical protein